jgi:TetR/AcrR family transcriptional regulator, cholesterol catabolism regulator
MPSPSTPRTASRAPAEATRPRTAARRAMAPASRRPRVGAQTEARILDIAFRFPTRGQDRVAADLCRSSVNVSASGVRYVWQRHNLETLDKRVAWVESRLSNSADAWSADQLAARDRVHAKKRAIAIGASVTGRPPDEVPRSMHILAVSALLIRERGFESTSLRDIAVRAHIPVGSIYYHFPTKDELFEGVYAEGIRRLQTAIERALARSADPWRRLELACETHLLYLCGGDEFTALAIPTRLPNLSSPVRERVVQLSDAYEGTFRKLVDALDTTPRMAKGILRLQLLGALNWTSVWYRPGGASLSRIAAQLVRTFRNGAEAGGVQTQRHAVPSRPGRPRR